MSTSDRPGFPRVKIVGHVCLDLVPPLESGLPDPGELHRIGALELRVGGCVANTGLALAALGADVHLEAIVGDDPLGGVLGDVLRSAAARSTGSVTVALSRAASHTTSYTVVLEFPGEDRRFLHHVGANAAFDGSAVELDGVELLHLGYPPLLPRLLEEDGSALRLLLDRARAAGCTTSVDLATSDPRDASTLPWRTLLRSWAPSIDILSPSLDDLRASLPRLPEQPLAAAARLADTLVADGVAVALVTAGRAGMALATGTAERLARGGAALATRDDWAGLRMTVRGGPVAAVRTTGAGDTATAGLLFGIGTGLDPATTLRIAASAAALHVSGAPALPRVDGSDYADHAGRLLGDPEWAARIVVADHEERELV